MQELFTITCYDENDTQVEKKIFNKFSLMVEFISSGTIHPTTVIKCNTVGQLFC